MRRPLALVAALLLLVLLAAPAGAGAASHADKALASSLTQSMRGAGPSSGAYVLDATSRRTLFKWNSDTPRILASNTKLFTMSAALDDLGADATFKTAVLGDGSLDAKGVWKGDLYLRGGGDPTFGSASFVRRSYGGKGATVEDLATRVADAGITRVSGRIVGDESLFDSLRGGPDSGYRTSIYVGPLSALSFNRGLANETGSAFQGNPPAFAAQRLDAALAQRKIAVKGNPAVGTTPAGAADLASVDSPTLGQLVKMTMKPSDNFFAEMIAKGLGDRRPATTSAGAGAAVSHAAAFGSRANLVDGSGLAHSDRASPRSVGRLLDAMRSRPTFGPFERALPIAGRDGTLNDRMRTGPARGRCHAKTGTLSNVSALSGYCTARDGHTLVFSILMNGVYPTGARKLQDRMAQSLAGYKG